MVGNDALPDDMDDLKVKIEEYGGHETRKILYDIALEKREKGEDDESLVRDAIKIILLGWNWRAYAGKGISNDDLNRQIENFLTRNRSLRRYLNERDAKLETLNFKEQIGDKSVEEMIAEEFNYLTENLRGVGTTGASKMFHMFYPQVFMMWDTKIRKKYGKKTTGEGYVSFLKDNQGFIQNNTVALNKAYPTTNHVKLMDEYNFAAHSLDTNRNKKEDL